MLSLSLPFALAVVLLQSPFTVPASPTTPSQSTGRTISLFRKPTASRNAADWANWAKAQRDYLVRKYSDDGNHLSLTDQTQRNKRETGTNLLTNQYADTSFFGSIAVGTPPESFNVILDTGSSDLWLGARGCSSCGDVKTFDYNASSSFQNSSAPFSIQYGSGGANGWLGQDMVQMAGFSVLNQEFGLCNNVSDGMLEDPVSGLMGLAFQTIAQSGATPFWQTLAESRAWDAPLMAFHLTRFLNDSSAQNQEPGGSFDMGFLNTSLFTGEIEYTNIPSGQATYWIIPLSSISASSFRFKVSSDAAGYAAIDTGTTLIGGPPEAVEAIFEKVPGSEAGKNELDGYYTYPCSNSLNVSLSFGSGQDWVIDDADMKLNEMRNGRCVAALFALRTGSSAPPWIIGDTFLKNVYSVFRYTPPSVGFAHLSESALAMNGVNGPPPTATIGSAAATVSANTGGARVANEAGAGGVGRTVWVTWVVLWSGWIVGCFEI